MTPTAPSGLETLRPEARLLHTLATPRWSDEAHALARHILTGHREMDWSYFLDQALRHHVVPLVGRNLQYSRVWQPQEDGVLIPYPWIYSAAYEANSRRNRALFGEFRRIFHDLRGAGVRHAVRKGPVLCHAVYEDAGTRRMADLDLLIEEESFPEVRRVLTELGYAQGLQSANGAVITPYARATRAFWSMHLTNKLPFKKPTSDPDVDFFEVDLCLNLFQRKSRGAADTRTLLDRSVPLRMCGTDARVLAPADHLLDVCLHLYKEATSHLSIERGKDITLQRFLDVAEAVRLMDGGAAKEFTALAAQSGAEREVYFALAFARRLYPDAVPESLAESLRPDDLGYLDEYGELDGKAGRWTTAFLDRLFDPDRRRQVAGSSTIPHQ